MRIIPTGAMRSNENIITMMRNSSNIHELATRAQVAFVQFCRLIVHEMETIVFSL